MDASKQERKYKKFYVDFNVAISNNLTSLESAEKYFKKHTKLNGLRENLGKTIVIEATGKSDKQKNCIAFKVDDRTSFSKRYIKYLTRKFLKKDNLTSFLHVLSSNASTYVVKLYKRNTE